jgi:cytochrome c oxidase assembly protein Cox11
MLQLKVGQLNKFYEKVSAWCKVWIMLEYEPKLNMPVHFYIDRQHQI